MIVTNSTLARLAVAAAIAGLTPSLAVANCGPHQEMIKVLAKKYLESPKAVGTVNDDKLVELFVSAQGSWTILVTRTNGSSCIIAAGQNWEDVPVSMRSLDPAA